MDLKESLIVLLLGLAMGLGIAAALHEVGRDDCEKNLSRTEKCIGIWIPEKEKLNVDTAN